jgi:type II secretory pathway component GspD/PulD (secretin)
LCANADVRQVANEIPGNGLGLTYVIDPRVQGTITLRTARPLKRSDAIGVLEDVLAMNGAALVRAICLSGLFTRSALSCAERARHLAIR